MEAGRHAPSCARNVKERRFSAPQGVQRRRLEMSPTLTRKPKREFWNKARAGCSILTGLGILGGLYLGR
jgi:hypothetical protein